MAARGGQPGNQNAAKSRRFEQALERAIAQDDGVRIRKAAETLLDKAALGEPWAIKELRDTLDGKPAQAVTLGGDPDQPLYHKIVREIVRPENQDS